jgi:hypothetical protein
MNEKELNIKEGFYSLIELLKQPEEEIPENVQNILFTAYLSGITEALGYFYNLSTKGVDKKEIFRTKIRILNIWREFHHLKKIPFNQDNSCEEPNKKP